MKECYECGTLNEDDREVCISCGSDCFFEPSENFERPVNFNRCNSDTQDQNGRTVLMKAIRFKNEFARIKELIYESANINIRDNNGESALMYAARYADDPKIVELLLRKKADISVFTDAGNNVLWFAQRNKTPAKVAIQKVFAPYVKEIEINTQFIRQIQNRKMITGTLEKLIKDGVDVNLKDINGNWTALMVACYTDDIESVKILIENGADVNIKKVGGGTALMIAVTFCTKNLDVIKALLEKKTWINIKDDDGLTALMYAAKYAHDKEVINLLIEYGADVNVKDKNGKTYLDYVKQNTAIENREKVKKQMNEKLNENLIKVIEQGLTGYVSSYLCQEANPNAKRESDGKSALQIAAEKGNDEIIALLKQYGAKE